MLQQSCDYQIVGATDTNSNVVSYHVTAGIPVDDSWTFPGISSVQPGKSVAHVATWAKVSLCDKWSLIIADRHLQGLAWYPTCWCAQKGGTLKAGINCCRSLEARMRVPLRGLAQRTRAPGCGCHGLGGGYW